MDILKIKKRYFIVEKRKQCHSAIKEPRICSKTIREEAMAGQPKPDIRPILNIVIVVGNLHAPVRYALQCFCVMVLMLVLY